MILNLGYFPQLASHTRGRSHTSDQRGHVDESQLCHMSVTDNPTALDPVDVFIKKDA